MVKIIIKGELPDFNKEMNLAKKHWSYYAAHKLEWTNYVAYEVRYQHIPVLETPIVPKFIWYTKNLKKDIDNIAFAKKYILDGFKLAGIIPDDGRKFVTGFGGEEFFVDALHPRVEVII